MAELDAAMVRGVVERYAALIARLDDEIGKRPLVLPNSKFFPDAFEGDAKSLRRLVRRMQKHAGMRDIPIRTEIVEPDEPEHASGGGCGSGACAAPKLGSNSLSRVAEDDQGWILRFAPGELSHPIVLTANVGRALGYVFLMETQPEGQKIQEPVEISIELAAVALGFGELLLEGSHIYAKGCGGPRVASVTSLGPEELSLATALFVARGQHSARAVRGELPATQQEAFDEAYALIDSNRRLIELLDRDPARVAEGDFELEQASTWLARVFKKKAGDDDLSLAELEKELAKRRDSRNPNVKAAKDPVTDELRALVDEALMTPRS